MVSIRRLETPTCDACQHQPATALRTRADGTSWHLCRSCHLWDILTVTSFLFFVLLAACYAFVQVVTLVPEMIYG